MATAFSFARTATLLGGAAIALAAAGSAMAAAEDTKYKRQSAVMCHDGSHATDKTGCAKHGGIKAGTAGAATAAVQTESAKVSATGEAPTTGLATRTPAKPDSKAK